MSGGRRWEREEGWEGWVDGGPEVRVGGRAGRWQGPPAGTEEEEDV